jgi:type II secretory ATPase GspE/PulE/Tfp pilus assembly ATPase PilB-like protein
MSPSRPATLNTTESVTNPGPRPTNLHDMLLAVKQLRSRAVVGLDAAIEQLQLLDHATVAALQNEDPDLLRSKSPELVRRMLLTQEDLEHALALTAGVVEVDAGGFDIDARAFELVPLRIQRALDCLVLGEHDGFLYVASWCPTSDDQRARLSALTSRAVMPVWGERDAIAVRLERKSPLLPLSLAEQSASALRGGMSRSRPAEPYSTGHGLMPEQQDIDAIMGEAVRELASGEEPEESVQASESSSIVRMVKRIIIDAQTTHASDIHVETNPGDQSTRIRFRRDGDMEQYQELPPQLRAPLV